MGHSIVECVLLTGTRSAEGIMASGHVNRAQRPNTWLLRPNPAGVKKVLANPEPSTHGPKPTFSGSAAPAFCCGDDWVCCGNIESETTAVSPSPT
jgi:hypothetical protein